MFCVKDVGLLWLMSMMSVRCTPSAPRRDKDKEHPVADVVARAGVAVHV